MSDHHTGLTERIRELLKKRGALTRLEICLALEANPEKVRSAITQMMMRIGGVDAVAGTSPRKYSLVGTTEFAGPVRKGSGSIAQPCREREWKPLRRDPFAHMHLALAARR